MPDQKQFDVAVIGAGPGGYVAALRAAQLGLSTAIVEKRESLGGTCLNIGCIPSKALLDSSELFARIRDEATEHGISVGTPKLDLQKMLERKDAVVKKLTGGVKQLVKGRKITHIEGIGSLKSSTEIVVESNDGSKQTVRAQHIILASGSVPIELPFLPFDGETVVSSTEAPEFDSVPKEMVVVGAGAIGLELGSVWSRLGSHVTVVEIMQDVLPGWDGQVSKTMKRELGKQGIEFLLGHKVTGLTGKSKKKITVEDPEGKKLELPADKVLVAVGRRPYYDGLGIEELGVELHEKSKRIEVDEQFKTSLDGVYAIGDLIHGPMLAHKAEDEGVAVAEIIAGKPGHVNYEAVPGVVYTWPEAACVGKSEEQLKEAGIPYAKGAFGFAANGRALAMNSTGGFVKILAHKETDRLLGAHIVGPWASDLISELVTVLEFGGSAEDVARIVHAHPTLPEAVKEAAMAVDKRSIHSL
ncbi:MAG: dihydrolipoyl dehydrogenase [Spirochaetota bacterium]